MKVWSLLAHGGMIIALFCYRVLEWSVVAGAKKDVTQIPNGTIKAHQQPQPGKGTFRPTTTFRPTSTFKPTDLTVADQLRVKHTTGTFEKSLRSGRPFVDKTMFIVDFLRHQEDVISVSRPRKTGKSLNIDMLYEFLDVHGDFSRFNDKDLAIMKKEFKGIRDNFMNKFPVIRVDFIRYMGETLECAKRNFQQHIRNEVFTEFLYLSKSDNVSTDLREQFSAIMDQTAKDLSYETSIWVLSKMVSQYHGVAPFIFFDEVDTPLVSGLLNGYLHSVEWPLHAFFLASLKQNQAYQKVLLCSVLPIFEMSPLSTVNNVFKCSIGKTTFQDSFGFTESEVNKLLQEMKLDNPKLEKTTIEDLKEWYDDLVIGNVHIFNPVSVKKCLENDGKLTVYEDAFSRSLTNVTNRILLKSGLLPQFDFVQLVEKKRLSRPVLHSFRMDSIFRCPAVMWTYFYHAGVIVKEEIKNRDNKYEDMVSIPGRGLREAFKVALAGAINTGPLKNYDEFIRKLNATDGTYVRAMVLSLIQNAGDYLRKVENYDEISMDQLKLYLQTVLMRYNETYRIAPEVTNKGDVVEIRIKQDRKRCFIFPKYFVIQVQVKLRLSMNNKGLMDRIKGWTTIGADFVKSITSFKRRT